ncbi:MAG: TIM44-like domain-containing protein [Kiritimatiellia bacterium]
MKLKLNRHILILLLTGAALFICDDLLARAGGGGGFSGGGSRGGGGGSSGGDGLGIIIYFLIRLIVEKPLIGIPVAATITAGFVLSAKKGRSSSISRTIRKGGTAAVSLRLKNEMNKIIARDPSFDAERFKQRCAKLLPEIQYAWSAQDMLPVRHFVSDGVFDRFTLQIEIQKGSGIRNIMEDVQVTNTRLVDAESDDFFDTIHLAITARAVDQLVTLDGNRRLQGSSAPERFTEIWTFLRRPGAETLERPGLLEGFCPNCGTRLRLSTSTTCGSCGALINSGEYDWVLSEITQAEVWSPHNRRHIPGIQKLRERDPGFNAQAIEDRVSAVFWHHHAAEFFANRKLLSGVALPTFTEREEKFWVGDASGRHRFYADTAVGRVDLAEVIPAETTDDPDRVRVMVEWSGHRETGKVPGLIKPQWNLSRLMRQDYILMRKQGVKSVEKTALTSSHCPGCGAPQVAESTGECRYCGLAQNDGSSSWVLESVSAFSGFMLQPPADQPVNSTEAPAIGMQISLKEQESMIQCMAAVMLADGEIDPAEDRQLKKMAAKHKVPPQRLYELVHQVQTGEETDIPELDDWQDRNRFFQGLVRMCLADGNVSHSERRILKNLVSQFGYSDIDINAMIARERQVLYKASKQAIRKNKRSSC